MTKGFTLLELVIVIGILAVLGAISVLVLNPAQLFAQARDTTRIEDMGVLRNALALYVSTVSTPTMGVSATCYVSSSLVTAINCGGRHVGTNATFPTNPRLVNGSGWIPVDMGAVSGGPALSVLPLDPTNSADYFYSYANNDTAKTYELNAKMESERYRCGGSDDKERADGGNKPATSSTACTGTQPSQNEVYEIGTDAGLDL